MKFAIIIRGPAGAGKSEVADKLKQEIPNTVHIDIDKLKHIISKDSSKVRSEIAHKVGSFFLEQLIENDFNIIVEEIFREDYYKEIVQLFKKTDYPLIKVFLKASKETLMKRDKKRIKNKGKEVISRLEKEIKPLDEDLIIDSTNKSFNEIKFIILKKLKKDKVL